MKTLNYLYSDTISLQNFILNKDISNNHNVFVQVFTGICEVTFIKDLVLNIKKSIPDVKIIGSTTSGEIMDDKAYDNSTIISFSIFDNTKIVTYTQESLEDSYLTAKSLISKFDNKLRAKVAISFVDGVKTNGETYLKAFYDYDKDLIISGGLAGDNATFKGTIVFNEEEILTNGCVIALLYNDNLTAHTKAIFGWENIGKTLTVTKAVGNIVFEIDNIKAVDIYAKYLGKDVANELPRTGIEFPLIIKRNGLNIPRAVIGKNSDSSLVFAGSLNVGDKVTFGYGNIDAILDGGYTSYKEIAKNSIESIFIYSCMARKALMADSIALELGLLNSISSLSGFFTYGEFFSSCKTLNNELLNQTMTILSLSENKKEAVKIEKNNFLRNTKNRSKTLKAFSHLVYQTTLELEEINLFLSKKVKTEVENNRKKDQQLLQQSRLAQMGEMMSMIAHQWRQPLAAIGSTSTALELKARLKKVDNAEVVKQAKKISNYTQHLSSTIDDFRDFFRSNKEEKESTFYEIVEGILSIIETSIVNKNIKLIKNLNSKETFKTYQNEMKQVVLNLIKNAEDILLEREIDNPYIKIHSYKKGDEIILEVSDNAGGIEKNIIGKIFDPYFSTKLKKNGTGLGLYMSKTIVEEHCGGILSVYNNEKGAVFKIAIKI